MKAEELFVGALVRVNRDGLCIKKDTIVEVRAVDADDKLIEKGLIGSAHCRPLDDNQFEGGIWCEYLDPLPITPEILEKNGWKQKKGFIQHGNFGNGPLMIWHTEDNKILRNFTHEMEISDLSSDRGFRVRFDCNYVHELQHCLALLGIGRQIELPEED